MFTRHRPRHVVNRYDFVGVGCYPMDSEHITNILHFSLAEFHGQSQRLRQETTSPWPSKSEPEERTNSGVHKQAENEAFPTRKTEISPTTLSSVSQNSQGSQGYA